MRKLISVNGTTSRSDWPAQGKADSSLAVSALS